MRLVSNIYLALLTLFIPILLINSLLVVVINSSASPSANNGIPNPQMDSWASKFASPLFNYVQSITKFNELQGRYQNSRDATVEKIQPSVVLAQILESFKDSFQEKVDILMKSAAWAEERAQDFYLNNRAPKKFNYIHSKRINDDVEPEKGEVKWKYPLSLDTKMNRHFSNSLGVNLSSTTVHVPTITYDLDPILMKCINWTSDMDTRFITNFKEHPTLKWQYFCSVSGLLRQYPGIEWPFGNSPNLPEPQMSSIDIYDCRMRPWYIGASSSHKSIIILMDMSGSMTGLRSKIGVHVAFTILETLTDNDKMAVLSFDNETRPVVECFKHKFVEATPENVRSVKQGLALLKAEKFVNLTYALDKAFAMFEQVPNACNKAIFLITDGAPSNNEEIIRARQNNTNQIRIFTYLIGREATDAANVQHIACTNNGYFSHLSTLSQVQEQVLKYIPVMSRPIVFSQTRDVTWSPIYVNQIIQPHINPATTTNEFDYMISASLPVHETHSQRNATQTETKVQFLGVVGTDIPYRELHILSNPFSMGSNGYIFILTNNGHVVLHPRWTPHVPKSPDHEAQILKPNYQAMDIGEIEIIDSDDTWRNNDSVLMEMRHEMIMKESGSKKGLKIRIPQDEFKRVTIRTQTFEYGRIPQTPYTLAVVLQDQMNKFIGRFDIQQMADFRNILGTFNYANEIIAEDDDEQFWFVNPLWLYCEYLQNDALDLMGISKEEELVDILNKFVSNKDYYTQEWSKLKDGDYGEIGNSTGDKIRCNKELIESFIFDANVTEVFKSTNLWKFGEKDKKTIAKYGFLKAFITTRSGLTRWVRFEEDEDDDDEEDEHNSTIHKLSKYASPSTLYYQRAIDNYLVDSKAFVYTISSKNPKHVIATRAVHTHRNGLYALAAVVGLQIEQKRWADQFFQITDSVCITEDTENCLYSCKSSEFDCFVLDDNGYVIISEDESDNGKFFGEIHSGAMEGLINANIYRRVEFYDYQSICFGMAEEEGGSSAGPLFESPMAHILTIWNWFITKLSFILINFLGNGVFGDDDMNNMSSFESTPPPILSANEILKLSRESASLYDYETIVLCDMKYNLFTYGSRYNSESFSHTATLPECDQNCIGTYSSRSIPHTNLIMVITDGTCSCTSTEPNLFKVEGEREDYSNNCPPRAPYEIRMPEQCMDLNAPNNKEKSAQQDCGKASRLFTTNISFMVVINVFCVFVKVNLII